MIYGVFTFVETFAGFVLNMIPYFAWLKLGFFGWLMLPQFKGAQVIYDQVLKPQLEKHSELIEELIANTMSSAENAKNAAKDVAKENLTLDNLNAANKKLL
jgi:hypothetical protein